MTGSQILPSGPDPQQTVRVRRGRVDSVDLYEIKDTELDTLERGSPADLQLNFAIFLISAALSTLLSLLTATFPNPKMETFFMLVTIVGFLLGAYLFIAWYRSHTSVAALCRRIRSRIPPEAATPDPKPADAGEEPVG